MERANDQIGDDLQALRINRERASHPKSGGRLKWLVVIAIFACGIVTGALLASRLKWMALRGLAANKVEVATATFKAANAEEPVLTAGGYVIARHQVEVGSKITGRVIALEIEEGDFVARNQVIARLDNYELSAQVRQAEANLAAAKTRLAELEAGSRPQEVERANADLSRTDAELKNALLNFKRIESLVRQGVTDQKSLEDARTRYDIAVAAQRGAKQSYELARIGPRQEAINLARAQVNQATAELAYAHAQLENTVIRAPIDGTVLERHVDLGEMVTTGFTSNRGAKQALVTMADLKNLLVELEISEAEIAKVQPQQPAIITADAYPDRRYKGVVEHIASAADRQKGTVKVKLAIADPDEYLRPDMGAKANFHRKGAELSDRPDIVTVPKSAIVQQGNGNVVYLVRDSKVAIKSVSLGKEDGGYVEILSGLGAGEKVITGGQSALKEGDEVSVEQ
jgi:HlyD family secretion protein